MDINKFKESYLEVITESIDTDLKNYIKDIVEEVLEEAYLDDEGTTSPEAKKIYSLLKKYGYKSFGSKKNVDITFGKIVYQESPGIGSDHRVTVDRSTGKWNSTANTDIDVTRSSGKTASDLEPVLKDVELKMSK
jgi:hypothetical protein